MINFVRLPDIRETRIRMCWWGSQTFLTFHKMIWIRRYANDLRINYKLQGNEVRGERNQYKRLLTLVKFHEYKRIKNDSIWCKLISFSGWHKNWFKNQCTLIAHTFSYPVSVPPCNHLLIICKFITQTKHCKGRMQNKKWRWTVSHPTQRMHKKPLKLQSKTNFINITLNCQGSGNGWEQELTDGFTKCNTIYVALVGFFSVFQFLLSFHFVLFQLTHWISINYNKIYIFLISL